MAQEIIVTLTDEEMLQGARIGVTRQLENLKADLKDRGGKKGAGEGYGLHVVGAQAEIAAAKALNVYYHETIFAAPDIVGCEIRSTEYANGNLILHDSDIDKPRAILVTFHKNIFTLCGWIVPADFISDKYRNPKYNSYWVPQSLLRPMSTITF